MSFYLRPEFKEEPDGGLNGGVMAEYVGGVNDLLILKQKYPGSGAFCETNDFRLRYRKAGANCRGMKGPLNRNTPFITGH